MSDAFEEQKNLEVASRWCEMKGPDWLLIDTAGRGGTAPVFSVSSPAGELALKLYDARFSEGALGDESERRLEPQLNLGLHTCSSLVRIHDAGRFENRLFVLMDKAPGRELEKQLKTIVREDIRGIVDQVARAAIFLRQKGLSHRDIKSANIFFEDETKKVTLLDLSVLRDVHDPIGLGTDQGGQLPVVATSRYSPPEYLFRLVPPSPQTWHALDVYQLGGLLHDLIMREPMFEQEYLISRDSNRYRFAWIVAMQSPAVAANDVDADLVTLARRALDKNWERRTALRLEDFLNEASVHREQGLLALGAKVRGSTALAPTTDVYRLMNELGAELDGVLVPGLKAQGFTVTHQISRPSDECRCLTFSWQPEERDGVHPFHDIKFRVWITRHVENDRAIVSHRTELEALKGGVQHSVHADMPDVPEGEAVSTLASSSLAILGDLAAELMKKGDHGVVVVG